MRINIIYRLILIALFVSGCSSSDSPSQQPAGPITLLSPKDAQTIRYSNVTFEVDIQQLTDIKAKNLSIDNSSLIDGVNNADILYVYRIPLIEGNNNIEVSAKNEEGENVSIQVTLISENAGYAPITLDIENNEGYGSIDTRVAAKPFVNAKEYLIDKEGNGVIDDANLSGEFNLTYNAMGRYIPIMTVRTKDNILYTDSRNLTTPVDVKAMPLVSDVASINDTILDLESDGDYI